jgi:hypothetical protein
MLKLARGNRQSRANLLRLDLCIPTQNSHAIWVGLSSLSGPGPEVKDGVTRMKEMKARCIRHAKQAARDSSKCPTTEVISSIPAQIGCLIS